MNTFKFMFIFRYFKIKYFDEAFTVLHCLTRFVCIFLCCSINHLLTLKDVLYYFGMPGYTKHNLSHSHLANKCC